MDTTTRVQILDETDCVAVSTSYDDKHYTTGTSKRPVSDVNDGILCIPQSSWIEASPLDC